MTQSQFVFSETLAMVLGHSLWEATAIAMLVGIVLRGLPAKHANLRHLVAVAGLFGVVVSAFVTWSILRLDRGEQAVRDSGDVVAKTFEKTSEPALAATSTPTVVATPAVPLSVTGTPPSKQSPVAAAKSAWFTAERQRSLVPALTIAWAIGAVLMLARGVVGQVTVRKWLAESALESTGLDDLRRLVAELSDRLGLRRVVQIVVSNRLSVPAVVGILSPVILVPSAMLTGIPVEQWRIILAHELVHVRRWDAVVNVAQLIVESLLFFNPAVWWLSRQIRIEREACCDALAVKVCGEPLSVAWALVDVATVATSGRSQFNPHGALAFAEPANEGELTDRVRRLIDPNRTPRSKVSWLSFAAVLLAICCVAVVLNRSTDVAVRTAAAWMSPKDRIDKLVQLEAEQNGIFLPSANLANASSATSDGGRDSGTEPKISVELIVKMEDGSDVTRKLDLRAIYQSGNSSTNTSLEPPQEDAPEYRKIFTFPPCQLRIGASLRGQAAAATELLSLLPDSRERTVELVLSRGVSVPVSVQNELGQPIPEARVRTGFLMNVRGSGSTLTVADQQSDSDGRVVVEHIIEGGYSFELQASGYQRMNVRQDFGGSKAHTAETPLVLKMRSARPAFVKVIDAKSGEPLKDARFRIVRLQEPTGGMNYGINYGFTRRWYSPDLWSDYGTTDADGRAVLNQLRNNATYSFAIVVPEYATALMTVRAGQPEQTVAVGRPLTISGELTGALDRLMKRTDGKPGYQFSAASRLSDHVNDNTWVLVDSEGHFTTVSFSPGERVTLLLPDERHDFVMKESLTDITYEIRPASGPSSVPRREVVIRLTGVSIEAPARGLMYVSWQHPTIQTGVQNGPLPISGNEIRLQVPVGAQLNFHEQEIAGYRVSERSQIEIGAGDDAMVIDAPAVVMGGIYGSLKHADGSSADGAFVRIFPIKLPLTEKNDHQINPSVSSGGSQYLREVPIGGSYRVLATEKSATGYVWAVSEVVTIDGSDPIVRADINLPKGRDLSIRVLDESGKPVADQPLELELSFQLKGSSSRSSSSISATTDPSGIATFRGLALDQKLDPLTWSLSAVIKPNSYRGVMIPIEKNGSSTIRLKKGVSGGGVVIDVKSRKPIPDVEVRLIPRHFEQASYKGEAVTRTDAEGRFHFAGLEPIEYTGYVSDTSPKGTIIESYGNGGYRFKYPTGVEQHALTGGGKDVRWEVMINSDSH
ncbi:MAG: hypothetical protein JWP89_5089 [Schlesneria sp.]|nr:hypothetical protein [Schlesneria sp.]